MSWAGRCLNRRALVSLKWRENRLSTRGILTEAMHANDKWSERLAAPVFDKIKMGEYFIELDRKFANEYRGSAVDVDIFANNVQAEGEAEQMEELLHKLRRTPSTVHTPPSTHHAAIRAMVKYGTTENLVRLLDDRVNYGVFLDEYTAAFALDKLFENGEFKAGARVAAQLMFQEEEFPLAAQLGLCCCWKYLLSGREEAWYYPDEIEVDPNPEEVIRVRVKMLPNNYFDEHFDLREPDHILGKTLVYLTGNQDDTTSRSLKLLGYSLWGKEAEATELLKAANGEVSSEVDEILKTACPDMHAKLADSMKPCESGQVEEEMMAQCKQLLATEEKKFLNDLGNLYVKWSQDRDLELKSQYERMQREARIQNIEQTKAELDRVEERLFFFNNQDRYLMEKEEKVKQWARTLPRTDWNMKWYPLTKHYKKRPTPDGERKVARWERREQKKGPPK